MWIRSFLDWHTKRRARRKFRRHKIYDRQFGFANPDNLVWVYINQLTRLRKSWDIGPKPKPEEIPVTQKILAGTAEERLQILLDAVWAATNPNIVEDRYSTTDRPEAIGLWRLVALLVRKNLPYTDHSICVIFGLLGSVRWNSAQRYYGLYQVLERYVAKYGVSDQLREALLFYRDGPHSWSGNKRIGAILGDVQEEPVANSRIPSLHPSPWGKKVRDWIYSLEDPDRETWIALFNHTEAASIYSRPRKRWLEYAQGLIERIGAKNYSLRLKWLLAEFDTVPFRRQGGDQEVLDMDVNQGVVLGLIWIAQPCGALAPVDAIRQFAIRCYTHRVYGEPYAEKLGNVCFLLLDSLPDGLGLPAQFALHGDVVHGRGRNIIARNIGRTAKRLGKTVEELGEYAIPTFGLDEKGRRWDHIDQFKVTVSIGRNGAIRITQTDPQDPKKKQLSLRRLSKKYYFEVEEFAQLRELMAREIQRQSRKIEEFYSSKRVRRVRDFRQRYLHNPVVSHLVRRLVWELRDNGLEIVAMLDREGFTTIDGQPISRVSDDTVISLWHPLRASVEEVHAWRRKITVDKICQPFEQAYREIFIPTDVELETATYSNRFAGHFVAGYSLVTTLHDLGWVYEGGKNWKEIGTATRYFPNFGLKAEFVEDPVSDAAEGGSVDYRMSSTDHVRFIDVEGNRGSAVPITEVPALVFSEVMHDLSKAVVDSAMAVNLEWRDHTDTSRPVSFHFRRSFRHAEQDADVRLKRLEEILPQLTIADRCEVRPPYLDIRGKLGAYRIHAGNAAVFKQPNDLHLCIVAKPDKSAPLVDAAPSAETDTILTTVLSKAFLLADDDKITDPSILSQIRR